MYRWIQIRMINLQDIKLLLPKIVDQFTIGKDVNIYLNDGKGVEKILTSIIPRFS